MICKSEGIELEGYGTFLIYEMTWQQLEECNKFESKERALYIAQQCCMDAAGKPIFTSMEEAKQAAFNFILTVADAIANLSGMAKKNSAPTDAS